MTKREWKRKREGKRKRGERRSGLGWDYKYFYEYVLGWDYFTLVKQKPDEVSVKDNFADLYECTSTLKKALVQKAKNWIFTHNGLENLLSAQTVMTKYKKPPSYGFYTHKLYCDSGLLIFKEDLVLLSHEKFGHKKKFPTNYAFGVVVGRSKDTVNLLMIEPQGLIEIDEADRHRLIRMAFFDGNREIFYLSKVCSLASICQEYIAVCLMSDIPTEDQINKIIDSTRKDAQSSKASEPALLEEENSLEDNTVDERKELKGCAHYKMRYYKIVSPCCERSFKCHQCHNDANAVLPKNERHWMTTKIRAEIEVICGGMCPIQEGGQVCLTCGEYWGEYYCDICKIYDDQIEKNYFHCNECGVCRAGGRNNYIHNKELGYCVPVSDSPFEGSTSSDILVDEYSSGNINLEDFGKLDHGCVHYRRRCKIVASCCHRTFTCHLCHNAAYRWLHDDEFHFMSHSDRRGTERVICAICDTVQPVSKVCSSCGVTMGEYFCENCIEYDDESDKEHFHCNDCGVCMDGPPEYYRHCAECERCIYVEHDCDHSDAVADETCAFCAKSIGAFSDTKYLECDHLLHRKKCYERMIQADFRCCPICRVAFDDSDAEI